MTRLSPVAPLALLALALGHAPARAAESLDTCAGFITSLPAVISTQGTWCMASDLATGIGWGSAITVSTNNVTIDCNHFKLGGLAAGLGTQATGISASYRSNVTVRNCSVRGFRTGVDLEGDGHVVEDSRFDANTLYGIYVFSDGGVVRRNLVSNTGFGTGGGSSTGIYAVYGTDVIDNQIVSVTTAPGAAASANGIFVIATMGARVQGNRIRDVTGDPATTGSGISVGAGSSHTVSVRDNHVTLAVPRESRGINCVFEGIAVAADNHVQNWGLGHNCHDGGGNVVLPLN